MKIPQLIFLVAVLGATMPPSPARSNEDTGEYLVNDAVADIIKKKFDAALAKLLEAERHDPNSSASCWLIEQAMHKSCLRARNSLEMVPRGTLRILHSRSRMATSARPGSFSQARRSFFPKETSLYNETFENLGWPTR